MKKDMLRSKRVLSGTSSQSDARLRKELEKGMNSILQKNGRVKYELKYNRKKVDGLTEEIGMDAGRSRKELEVSRSLNVSQANESMIQDDSSLKKRIQKERKVVFENVKKRASNRSQSKDMSASLPQEWKEQVVRVGTGYRVRKDERDPRKRRFDVGYSDRKTYKRKEGREATVESSNMGRTIVGKGKDARVRVMNAVCDMEKRRPASEYTGSGILRKSRVGKLKLKPTKPSGKE